MLVVGFFFPLHTQGRFAKKEKTSQKKKREKMFVEKVHLKLTLKTREESVVVKFLREGVPKTGSYST